MVGGARQPEAQTVVEEFADALDADDFDVVQRRLTNDCVYLVGKQRHVGPEAVVASYRDGSHLARRLFEDVIFSHVIVSEHGADSVLVEFRDELLAGGEWFSHRSRQRITVQDGGLVSRIEDIPIPGEGGALADFMQRHGIER
jgi:limonene-1,2-epoxide hydrolase